MRQLSVGVIGVAGTFNFFNMGLNPSSLPRPKTSSGARATSAPKTAPTVTGRPREAATSGSRPRNLGTTQTREPPVTRGFSSILPEVGIDYASVTLTVN